MGNFKMGNFKVVDFYSDHADWFPHRYYKVLDKYTRAAEALGLSAAEHVQGEVEELAGDAVEGWNIPVRRYKVMVTTDVIEGLDITALDCVRIVQSLG